MDDPFLEEILAGAAVSWEFKLLLTAGVVVGVVLLRWIAVILVVRRIGDPTVRLVWRQILGWLSAFFGAVLLAWVWFEGVGGVLTILTLVAAALTIVHKELVLNLSSWSVIAWRGVFALEDIVEIGAVKGRVTDLGPLYFTMSEMVLSATGFKPTGRTIRVPNMQVLLQPVINHSGIDTAWVTVDVKVPFETDWHKARTLLETTILEQVASTGFGEKGVSVSVAIIGKDVQLTGQFPCIDGSQVKARSNVSAALLDRLRENDISPS